MDNNRKQKGKETNIIVFNKKNVISEFGYDPSLGRYLVSHALIPVILTFFLAMFRQGYLLIIIMWIFFLWNFISNYKKLYPKSRKATEEEARIYELTKMKEAIALKDRYDSRVRLTDIYGYPKLENDEYNYCVEQDLEKYGESYEKARLREEEATKRSKMIEELAKIEEEYGSDWYEKFKMEVENSGL